MKQPRNYKTKQRDLILQAMQQEAGRHFTAEALADTLRQRGAEVGLATVYRNLDKLVGEGVVLKYTLPDGMKACYQYMGGCGAQPSHCHLVCSGCGEVEHLSCNEVDALAQHLTGSHAFVLDRQKTVLYGRCAHCAGDTPAADKGGCGCHSHAQYSPEDL